MGSILSVGYSQRTDKGNVSPTDTVVRSIVILAHRTAADFRQCSENIQYRALEQYLKDRAPENTKAHERLLTQAKKNGCAGDILVFLGDMDRLENLSESEMQDLGKRLAELQKRYDNIFIAAKDDQTGDIGVFLLEKAVRSAHKRLKKFEETPQEALVPGRRVARQHMAQANVDFAQWAVKRAEELTQKSPEGCKSISEAAEKVMETAENLIREQGLEIELNGLKSSIDSLNCLIAPVSPQEEEDKAESLNVAVFSSSAASQSDIRDTTLDTIDAKRRIESNILNRIKSQMISEEKAWLDIFLRKMTLIREFKVRLERKLQELQDNAIEVGNIRGEHEMIDLNPQELALLEMKRAARRTPTN